MLIVSRRKGQRIVIGHDIEVVVTEISRSSVKLGIQAPASHTILRGEVHEAIESANREAATADVDPAALPRAATLRQSDGSQTRQAADAELRPASEQLPRTPAV
jgi:carbon storage regulator